MSSFFAIAAILIGAHGQKTLVELCADHGFVFGGNFPYLVDGKGPNNWDGSAIAVKEWEIARREFGIVSAGWQMYPGHSWTAPDKVELSGIETFIRRAESTNLKIHFHGLGYNSRVPWLQKLPTTSEAEVADLKRAYRGYLDTTVKTLRGRVALWDICNEQLLPAYSFSGYQTNQSYWKAYRREPSTSSDLLPGEAWISETFRRVKELDPKAERLWLDFNNEVVCPKSTFMFERAKKLLQAGVPIDSIGFQMHLNTQLNRDKGHGLPNDEAYWTSFKQNLKRFRSLGVRLWITELDVTIDPKKDLTAELERQAEIYARVFQIVAEERLVAGIKVWGVLDKDVWGNTIPSRPNLWDEKGEPKPAYHAIVHTLSKRN